MDKKKAQSLIITILPLFLILFIILVMLIMGKKEYSVSLAFLSTAIFIYLFQYYKNKRDALNPDGVFSLIWIGCIGLSLLRLSFGQHPYDPLTWFVLIGSWLSFLMGSKIPEFAYKGNIESNVNMKKNIELGISVKKFKRNIVILFLISFLSFMLEVVKAGFIPILSSDMSAYVNFGLPFIHYNTVAMSVVVILSFYYLVNLGRDKIIKVIFLIGMLQIVSILSRQLLIFTFVGILIIYHYTKKMISIKKLSIITLTLLIVFSMLGGVRNQSLDYLYHVAQIRPDVEKHLLMWPYMYFTMGFENMRGLLNTDISHTIGRHTFQPIWALSRIVTMFPENQVVQYRTIKEFTVSTYLRDFYFDFGILGTILIPFFIGIASKFIYIKKKIRNKKVNLYLFLYIFILHNLIFTFFTNFYSNTSIMINIVYVSLVYFFSIQRNSNNLIDKKKRMEQFK